MTPLIHVGLAQHPKKGSGAQSLTMVYSDLVVLQFVLGFWLGYGGSVD